jgi:hypothetical protein
MATGAGAREIAQSHLELEDKIRQRAYEIYRQRGGTELDNWLEAEQEVLGKSHQPAQDRGTTVGSAGRQVRPLRRTSGSM